MTRSNQDRVKANTPPPEADPQVPTPEEPAATAQEHPLHFIVPTEMVDLPSGGRFYTEGHPLCNKDSIEVRHMTAKEEDILTSATLLQKGLALDKMVQSVIVDKKVKIEDMLVGDKNSILIWSRIFGYGPEYSTKVICPSCEHQFENTFDLSTVSSKDYQTELDKYEIQTTENNTFLIQLPRSKYMLEFKLLSGRDEQDLLGNKRNMTSLKLLEAITVSINEQTDRFYIKRAIGSLPIMDATVLKRVYGKVMPDVDMSQEVSCPSCGEVATLGVPLDANFFWPEL